MELVRESSEMMTVIGGGPLPLGLPDNAAAFHVTGATVTVFTDAAEMGECDGFALIVARPALVRLFGWSVQAHDGQQFHLSHKLRVVADALLATDRSSSSLNAYRVAKSIEMLCDTVGAIAAGALVPEVDAALTSADTRRIVQARQIIDERWHEPLTLATIARACGLNRAKLTRGFRALYRSSVSEALLERRLGEARRALLTTDLPVGQVAYRNGYLNNASFARAFGRRFGQSPSDCRARMMAAA